MTRASRHNATSFHLSDLKTALWDAATKGTDDTRVRLRDARAYLTEVRRGLATLDPDEPFVRANLPERLQAFAESLPLLERRRTNAEMLAELDRVEAAWTQWSNLTKVPSRRATMIGRRVTGTDIAHSALLGPLLAARYSVANVTIAAAVVLGHLDTKGAPLLEA